MNELCIDLLRKKKVQQYRAQEISRLLFRGMALAAVVSFAYWICTSPLIPASFLYIKQQIHLIRL